MNAFVNFKYSIQFKYSVNTKFLKLFPLFSVKVMVKGHLGGGSMKYFYILGTNISLKLFSIKTK